MNKKTSRILFIWCLVTFVLMIYTLIFCYNHGGLELSQWDFFKENWVSYAVMALFGISLTSLFIFVCKREKN